MKLKETIHRLLIQYKSLRDSDNKLTANVWNGELKQKGYDIKKMSAYDFIKLFADDKLSSPTSIRRHRAKFQEHVPSLRGDKYKARQVNAQNKWKQTIKQKGVYEEINNNFEEKITIHKCKDI